MQQLNKSKKSKSVRNSASERCVAYEIEIQFGEIGETEWGNRIEIKEANWGISKV
jgi:hypothetical protein